MGLQRWELVGGGRINWENLPKRGENMVESGGKQRKVTIGLGLAMYTASSLKSSKL